MSRDKFYGVSSLKVGDLVKIKQKYILDWEEAEGRLGVVIAETMRLFIPAASVLVLGEVTEFDIDEIEVVNESR